MATNIFQSGQKLTAQKLNDAIDSVAGLINPSNDYQWTQTPLGKMQTTWSTYLNSRNVNPQPLDIEVSIDPLSSSVALSGEQVGAVRRVFMNTGTLQLQYFAGMHQYGPNLPIGRYNWTPFIGVLGWQIQSADGVVVGDGQPHFSMWSTFGNQPSTDTPEGWTAAEKLYTNDVTRNGSKSNWWYTGITLDAAPKTWTTQPWTMNIIGYPLIVDVLKKAPPDEQGGGDATALSGYCKFPILVVSTQMDYFMRVGLMTKKQELANHIQTYYGAQGYWNFEVKDLNFVDDPNLVKTIASYQWSKDVQNGFYKQATNFIEFKKDYSANKVLENANFSQYEYKMHLLQYIDSDGKHVVKGIEDLTTTDKHGEEIDTTVNNVPTACTLAWDYDTNEAILSCISCDFAKYIHDNPLSDVGQYILSGMYTAPSISAHNLDKRVLWLNNGDATNIIYLDQCPNFNVPSEGKFHFNWSTTMSEVDPDVKIGHISEGVVQIGGYSYFSNGGEIVDLQSGTCYVCAKCNLGGSLAIEFQAYSDLSALNAAQGDLTKYIFPLYKVNDGEVVVDYRPMPNAGCWEIAESIRPVADNNNNNGQ